MVLIQTLLIITFSAIVSGIVSFTVSRKITDDRIEKQAKLQEQRERTNWYRRANTLAELTERDWWEVMSRGETYYKIEPSEIFSERSDELKEHAADGKTINTDDASIKYLEQAAANLNYAASIDPQKTGIGKEYKTIENDLLPILTDIENCSREYT